MELGDKCKFEEAFNQFLPLSSRYRSSKCCSRQRKQSSKQALLTFLAVGVLEVSRVKSHEFSWRMLLEWGVFQLRSDALKHNRMVFHIKSHLLVCASEKAGFALELGVKI